MTTYERGVNAAIMQSPAFNELARRKRSFIVPITIFAAAFFFSMPVLTGFTSVLDGQAFGPVTWAVVVTTAQYVMAFIVTHLYMRQATTWDSAAALIRAEYLSGDGEAPDAR